MDIGSAFTFMFDDEEWVKKLAIGGGIAFLGSVLSGVFIGVVLFLPLIGYILETIKRVRDGQPGLPEWNDFGGLFMKGLMVFLIGLVYAIPLLIFVCLFLIVIFGGQQTNSDLTGILSFLMICLSCLLLFFILLINLIIPAAIIRYAQYDTFSSAFQIGEIWNFIKNNIGDYIIVILLTLLAGLLGQLGFIVCIVGIFFTMFWAGLVQANLYGQLARQTN